MNSPIEATFDSSQGSIEAALHDSTVLAHVKSQSRRHMRVWGREESHRLKHPRVDSVHLTAELELELEELTYKASRALGQSTTEFDRIRDEVAKRSAVVVDLANELEWLRTGLQEQAQKEGRPQKEEVATVHKRMIPIMSESSSLLDRKQTRSFLDPFKPIAPDCERRGSEDTGVTGLMTAPTLALDAVEEGRKEQEGEQSQRNHPKKAHVAGHHQNRSNCSLSGVRNERRSSNLRESFHQSFTTVVWRTQHGLEGVASASSLFLRPLRCLSPLNRGAAQSASKSDLLCRLEDLQEHRRSETERLRTLVAQRTKQLNAARATAARMERTAASLGDEIADIRKKRLMQWEGGQFKIRSMAYATRRGALVVMEKGLRLEGLREELEHRRDVRLLEDELASLKGEAFSTSSGTSAFVMWPETVKGNILVSGMHQKSGPGDEGVAAQHWRSLEKRHWITSWISRLNHDV